MNALILCDREDLRLGYAAVLKFHGYGVFTAPEEGRAYTVVITDLGDNTARVSNMLRGLMYDKAVALVSPDWEGGELPPNTCAVLRKPVTGGKLLSAVKN